MPLTRPTREELAYLLALYDSIDDLAHDLSGEWIDGSRHEVVLAELWGLVKAYGEPLPGLNAHPAYAIENNLEQPVVVVESDGTILPPKDWARLKSRAEGLAPDTPVSAWFRATV